MISERALERVGRWRAGPDGAMPSPIVGSFDDLRSFRTNPAAQDPKRTQRSERARQRGRSSGANGPCSECNQGASETNEPTGANEPSEAAIRTNPGKRGTKCQDGSAERTDLPAAGADETPAARRPNEPGRVESKRTQPRANPSEARLRSVQTNPANRIRPKPPVGEFKLSTRGKAKLRQRGWESERTQRSRNRRVVRLPAAGRRLIDGRELQKRSRFGCDQGRRGRPWR